MVDLVVNGSLVERLDSFKYLGVHITEGLVWVLHTDTVVRRARQRLLHLRCSAQILRNLYPRTIESVLTGNITVRKQHQQDHRALQRVVCLTEHTISLPCIKDVYTRRCENTARRIIKDTNQPHNGLFSLRRSEGRYRIHHASTERLRKSFYTQKEHVYISLELYFIQLHVTNKIN